MNGRGFERADPVGLAIGEQVIKLAAIGVEGLTFIEDFAEHLLNRRDVFADAGASAQLRLDVRRSRQVVGMDMRIDNPVDGEVS